ncbi:MAG TPA: prolyl oligopeptidase family serine peptidase [Burkholderiales bacterium]|nr:prolyl oligopeptidase family serine peptidase [Burkholderiales bacterium]
MRAGFQYFPENFMWSQGMMIVIEMARWGGAAMSEVDRVGKRLKDKVGDNEAWGAEWKSEAHRIESMGDDAAAEARHHSAAGHYLRAATYYFAADRFVQPGPKKTELYESCLRCFRGGIKWRYPNVERVEVPYEGTTLPGWFMKAPVAGRAPTVCFFDGLDSTKELSVLFGGVELALRGIHTLAIDGPGQGEALRLRNLPSRHDYEVPAGAAYDYVAGRTDVDPKRVGIMAYSMGGYYAPRAAAFEKRFAACVAWGGHYDYHATWVTRRKILESGGNRVSAPHFQLPWVMGMPDMDSAMKKTEQYKLEGVADKVTCPFLVTHGADDSISPLENARLLYDAVSSQKKTLRVFTAEEGGSEHCQGDNRFLGATYVADWLAQTLEATLPSR